LLDDNIKTFLHTEYARVVRAVAVVCGDRERAEDAVQDAVVDVWVKRREVDDLAGWVTTAALNRARSRWRSAAAERRAFERLARRIEQTGVAPVVTSALDDRVARALAALPRNQREAVALYYLLDMPVAGVAARLGIAVGTAKVHLHRGRHALQAALLSTVDEKEIDRVGP
jgi:RNA polymerase sigma-70 factor (ECF subfamily)